MKIKAIVFDCWNTLFYDNINNHPFEDFAYELGFSFKNPKFVRFFEKHFMTQKFDNFEVPTKNLLNELGIEYSENLKEKLKNILKKFNSIEKLAFPEVFPVLRELRKNFKIILLTNTTSKGFELLCNKYNIEKEFDLILKSCDTGILKPNYALFDIILKTLGLRKEEVVVVGDNIESDVNAAEDFGFKAFLIDRKLKYFNHPNSISSLTELITKLKELEFPYLSYEKS